MTTLIYNQPDQRGSGHLW